MSKTIRNPSPEEVEDLKEAGRSKAVPIQKNTKKQKKEVLKYRASMSIFEPAAYNFHLPSRNTIVPAEYLEEDGSILLRPMTIKETTIMQQWLNTSPSNNDSYNMIRIMNLFKDVIDGCLRTNIDADILSYIDLLPTFFFVLSKTYGTFDVNFECPFCDTKTKIKKLDLLQDILYDSVPDDFEYPHPITTESLKEKFIIYLNFVSVGQTSEIFDPANGGAISTKNIHSFVDRIEDEGGNVVNDKMEYEILDNLGVKEIAKIKEFFNLFGSFGGAIDFKPHKAVCKNKKCEMYQKEQEGQKLPFEDLLFKIMDVSN